MILSTSWSPDMWRDKSSGAKRLCFLSEPHHPPSGRHWGLKFAIDVIVLSQQGCLMLSLTINVYDWGELQLTTCFFATQAWSFVVNDFLERSSLLETIKVPPLVNDPCRRFWMMICGRVPVASFLYSLILVSPSNIFLIQYLVLHWS